MNGVVTRNAEEVEWEEFDIAFYEVKDVTGRQEEPLTNAVNMVSCFGDNNASEDPELVSVDDEGNRATRERKYFDWTYVCPTNEDYREGVLDIVAACAEANEDVRLDDVGFARPEYCHCDRCNEQFAASEYDDRRAWRASVITDFVAAAAERIPGRTYLTLFPDPYPGHLYEEEGIDLDALSEYVDEFVIPLYDNYTTTYWLKVIASGFADRLERPFSIELYAVDVDLDNLVKATEVAEHYAKDVIYGYDAGTARGVIRRMAAEENEGETYAPE